MAGTETVNKENQNDDGAVDHFDDEPTACPKCGSDSDWGASSWCPDCGYYPGINDGIVAKDEPVANEYGEVEVEDGPPKPMVPIWLQWTVGSFAGVLVLSSLASTYFHYYGGDRGMWSLTQLIMGGVLLASGQFCALVYAMKESNDVSLTDMAVTPLEIWRHTFQNLPQGTGRLVMAVSGLTMMIGSIAIIGGIDYESFFDTPIVAEREKQPDIVKRAMTAAMENSSDEEPGETFEDSLNDFTDKVIDTKKLDATMPSESKPLSCFVYGYMQDGHREFGRLLVGASVMGKNVHVAEISSRALTPRIRQTLAVILPSMKVDEPAVETPFRGNWVKPTYHLDLSFDGWTVGGLLINPKLAEEEDG